MISLHYIVVTSLQKIEFVTTFILIGSRSFCGLNFYGIHYLLVSNYCCLGKKFAGPLPLYFASYLKN